MAFKNLLSHPTKASALEAFTQTFQISVKQVALAFVVMLAFGAGSSSFASEMFLDEGDGDFSMVPKANSQIEPTTGNQVPEDLLQMADAYVAEPVAAADGSASAVANSSSPAIDPTAGPDKAIEQSGDVADAVQPQTAVKAIAKGKSKEKFERKVVKKTSVKKSVASAQAKVNGGPKKSKAVAGKSPKGKKVKALAKASKKSNPSRKVASFAGGTYQVARKSCDMSSTPGGNDSVGTIKANRKIWVETAGAKTYRVYNKDGQPGYVRKSCF